MTPRVSVILYGHNFAEFVAQAVESVLGQSFGDLELIATDNGSTDQTPDILRAYAEKDRRVRLMLHTDNHFMGERWNIPIRACRGEFVGFLNGDDYYLPDKLQRQVGRLASLPEDYGVVYGPSWRLNHRTGDLWKAPSLRSSGSVLRPMLRLYHQEGFLDYHAPLLRRRWLEKCLFYEGMPFEGETIYFRIAMRCKFEFIDEPLCVLRDHDRNLGKAIKFNRDNCIMAMERLRAEPDFPGELLADWRNLMARILCDFGWQGVRVAADGAWARDCLLLALGYSLVRGLSFRVMAAWCLSWLPEPALRGINRLVNRLRRHRENIVFLDAGDIQGGRR